MGAQSVAPPALVLPQVEAAASTAGGFVWSPYNEKWMALAPATLAMAHGVLQFPTLLPRDPARDEAFIEAVAIEFPNVVSRQSLPAETPPMTPHLVLSSTSSQLAVSAVQADFEVRFYGEYASNVELGLEYIERKLRAILGGFDAIGAKPMLFGLISTLNFSFQDSETTPAEHILKTHLQTSVDPDDVQDALARVAVRLRDTYFVTLTVSNYESRIFERPLIPGINAIQLRPGEGRLEDVGAQLAIDINNNLEVRSSDSTPVVTETGVAAVMRVLREVVTTSGPRFVESGEVSADELSRVSAT